MDGPFLTVWLGHTVPDVWRQNHSWPGAMLEQTVHSFVFTPGTLLSLNLVLCLPVSGHPRLSRHGDFRHCPLLTRSLARRRTQCCYFEARTRSIQIIGLLPSSSACLAARMSCPSGAIRNTIKLCGTVFRSSPSN